MNLRGSREENEGSWTGKSENYINRKLMDEFFKNKCGKQLGPHDACWSTMI